MKYFKAKNFMKFYITNYTRSESAAVSVHQRSRCLSGKHIPEWLFLSESQLGRGVDCLEVKIKRNRVWLRGAPLPWDGAWLIP